MKQLLGPEYNGKQVDRLCVRPSLSIKAYADAVDSEIAGIRAVHFLLKVRCKQQLYVDRKTGLHVAPQDHLDRSYNASSTYDGEPLQFRLLPPIVLTIRCRSR